jgi:peroxiredoxin
VVAISVDAAAARAKVAAFVRRRALPFDVWLDPDDQVSARFGAASLPLTILIDRDGVIRFRRDGVLTDPDPELTRALSAALGR